MKKIFSLCIVLMLSACFFMKCKKDHGKAPALPGIESMMIDFTNFASLKKSADLFVADKGTNNSSWEFAANTAGVWKVIINTTLAVPIASFKLALDNDAAFVSDNNWQWSFTATPADVAYKVRLTGQVSAGEVLWKMYITREGTGGFPEFLWLEGKSNTEGTAGQWIFYESSQTPGAVLQIDWTRTAASVWTVKYTYMKNDTYKNNYIEYGKTSSTSYNAYYKISFTNIRGTFAADVEWSTATKNGRVKCPDYLDGRWFCWDENKLNNSTNCPQ